MRTDPVAMKSRLEGRKELVCSGIPSIFFALIGMTPPPLSIETTPTSAGRGRGREGGGGENDDPRSRSRSRSPPFPLAKTSEPVEVEAEPVLPSEWQE